MRCPSILSVLLVVVPAVSAPDRVLADVAPPTPSSLLVGLAEETAGLEVGVAVSRESATGPHSQVGIRAGVIAVLAGAFAPLAPGVQVSVEARRLFQNRGFLAAHVDASAMALGQNAIADVYVDVRPGVRVGFRFGDPSPIVFTPWLGLSFPLMFAVRDDGGWEGRFADGFGLPFVMAGLRWDWRPWQETVR